MISKVTFFSEVCGKLMVPPAPLPEVSTAPVSALSTRHDPMLPAEPDASRITIFEMLVAEPHLIEMEPVERLEDRP